MKYIIAILTVFLMTGREALTIQNVKEDYVVIDVRTTEEYLESHVKGSLHIDIKSSDFDENISKLDKNKNYKLYCRSGNRSGKALEIMTGKGFLHLENLGGLKDAIEKLHGTCEGKKPC